MDIEQKVTESDCSALDEVDTRIAMLLIEAPTTTDQMIADMLGLTRQTVNRRRNSSGVQKRVKETLSIPERETRRLVAKAMRRLEALLDNPDPKIQLSVTLALLKLSPDLRTGWSSENMMFLE